MLEGFPPAGAGQPATHGDCESLALILGSFPSVRSLEKREYYGNGRNHFWALVAVALGRSEPGTYEERLQMLSSAGISVWDVIGKCDRTGSLDRDIARAEINPVLVFLASNPRIRKVGLNGGLAYEYFVRAFSVQPQRTGPSEHTVRGRSAGAKFAWEPACLDGRIIQVMRLPSSSPVPSASFRSFGDKVRLWSEFIQYGSDDTVAR